MMMEMVTTKMRWNDNDDSSNEDDNNNMMTKMYFLKIKTKFIK